MEFESPLSQNTKAKIERLVGVTCPTSRSKVIPPLERDHLAPALLRRGRRFRFWFGRGRLHEAADLLRCTSLHIVGDVRMGIEGEPGADVAQHTGQGLHIHAAGKGHRSKSMAQIMEANTLLDACLRQQLPVNPGHRIQAPIAAGAGRREQDGIVGVLFMLPHQHIHRLLGQRHFADRVLCFQPCHHQFAIDTSDLLAHREYPVFHIQAIPRKCQQLSTP